jgi:hypothetical protein
LESRGKQAAETGKKRGGKRGRGEQKEKGKGNQTWDCFWRYRGEGKSKTEEGREEPPLHLHQRLHRSSQPLPAAPPSRHHQRCQCQQNQRGRRETGKNREGRKNRDRELYTEEEKKRQSCHRLESSSFLLPAASPTTFHHRQTKNNKEQNKHRRGAEKAEGSRKKKKQPLAATTVCRCCHHRHLSTASSSTQSLLLQVTPSPHLCFFVSLLACRTCTVHVSASKQNN